MLLAPQIADAGLGVADRLIEMPGAIRRGLPSQIRGFGALAVKQGFLKQTLFHLLGVRRGFSLVRQILLGLGLLAVQTR
jgi:hypothetical protein